MILDGLQPNLVLVIFLALALIMAAYTALCLMQSRQHSHTDKLEYPYRHGRRPY